MGVYSTKSKWQRILKPIVAYSVQHGIHPDVFTYSAIILSFVAGIAFFLSGRQKIWLLLVPPCLLLRLLLNLMDGLIARETGIADAWGEVKNEFGDRVADVAIFVGLIFSGYVNTPLASFVLAIILLNSYLGILGKAIGGSRIYSGVFGKGDRMISLAVFTLYTFLSGNLASFNWYLVFAALASIITLAQRVRLIYGYSESLS